MSKIEWTDVTWNPVIGCAKVSAGCKNCYAETMAARVALMEKAQGKESPYLRVVDVERRRWNGRAVFLPERLSEPLRWRKPRRVFVNSMSDLFHEDISFEQIAAVFGVMAATPHRYQVLTKRPARMLEFFRWMEALAERQRHQVFMHDTVAWVRRQILHSAAQREGVDPYKGGQRSGAMGDEWPLQNVHLGVSVEDQAAADERIPLLLQCPAVLRFLSVEPLLGPVDLVRWTTREHGRKHIGAPPGIGWVIVGGESGPGARPCGVDWIRSVVRQCRDAGVPVFVKQLGARPTFPLHTIDDLPADHLRMTKVDGRWHLVDMSDRKGADPSEWPEDLRVQEFPRREGC